MPLKIFQRECEAVYCALVADLALTIIPTSIMGLTLVAVGLVIWQITENGAFLLASSAGGAASALKIALMVAQRARQRHCPIDLYSAVRWERRHGMVTGVVASSVGLCCATALFEPDMKAQLLVTALLFGYCSGLVSRTAIRPKIACTALLFAAIPSIISTALTNQPGHHVLAVIFVVFLLGAFETVNHVHRSAARNIILRLDMAALARHDTLTGLLNRLGLREAFDREARSSIYVAVHCIDLDGFKAVNDQFGHAGGDEVLREVARRLRAIVAPHALVARVGGDEFVVLQGQIAEEKDAEALAKDIRGAFSEPFKLERTEVSLGGSVGYVVAATTNDFSDTLRAADEASYRSKRGGGGGLTLRAP